MAQTANGLMCADQRLCRSGGEPCLGLGGCKNMWPPTVGCGLGARLSGGGRGGKKKGARTRRHAIYDCCRLVYVTLCSSRTSRLDVSVGKRPMHSAEAAAPMQPHAVVMSRLRRPCRCRDKPTAAVPPPPPLTAAVAARARAAARGAACSAYCEAQRKEKRWLR